MTDTKLLRSEYDATLSSVSSRRSTPHFAHAAVSFFLCFIFSVTTGKLWWDHQSEYAALTAALGTLSFGLLAYSLVRYLLGRRALVFELQAYRRLRHLRGELGLDDPRAMLP